MFRQNRKAHMRNDWKRSLRILIPFLVLVCLAASASATVTTIADYRLGEDDPGAAGGLTGDDPTVDSVGGVDLTRTGSPTYIAMTPDGRLSSLAMVFAGSDRYSSSTLPTTVTDNFGIEAWVRSDGNTSGNAAIAYVGNTSTSGWGLFRLGASYGILMGGITSQTFAPVTTGWTHLALVRENGTSHFYVDGVLVGTNGSTPNTPAGNTMIGGNPLNGSEFFTGSIDEVRIFTFVPGEFRITDLGYWVPPIPAASPVGLAVLALLLGLAGAFAMSRIR